MRKVFAMLTYVGTRYQNKLRDICRKQRVDLVQMTTIAHSPMPSMSTSRFGGVDVDPIEQNPHFWNSCFYSSTRYPFTLSKSIRVLD